jgi:acyl carrier protein
MDREQLKRELSEILEESVGEEFPELNESTSLVDEMKLDSVDLLSMTIEIQSRYGIVINAKEVANIATVADVLDMIAGKIAAKVRKAA